MEAFDIPPQTFCFNKKYVNTGTKTRLVKLSLWVFKDEISSCYWDILSDSAHISTKHLFDVVYMLEQHLTDYIYDSECMWIDSF